MKLSDKQFKFAKMVNLLFCFLINNGYKFTIGEVWRPRDKKRRCHYHKLAVDINLFIPSEIIYGEYVYTKDTKNHLPIGEFWESIGGSWGGRFGDGNHYSLSHRGYK